MGSLAARRLDDEPDKKIVCDDELDEKIVWDDELDKKNSLQWWAG